MFESKPIDNGIVRNDVCSKAKVLTLFGTRPEAIKLAPVIHELHRMNFETLVVSSSQHTNLLEPFLETLNINVDHDLRVMRRNQDPNQVLARVMAKLDKVLVTEKPDLIVVQGDTTTALAGAMSGFNRKIPVAHVEAGLRSGNLMSPFPEEMNRRLVSQIASFHFAPTEDNKLNLLSEGVPYEKIFVTGNTVVDSLHQILKSLNPDPKLVELIKLSEGKRRILLTAHRRESFGAKLEENLRIIGNFVDKHDDVCVYFPVHPNPNVRKVAGNILGGRDRVHLLPPLDYHDFLTLMRSAWLIISDSGGVQEEAPTLGKPLLVLRENTERPEAVQASVARLVGTDSLEKILEHTYAVNTWIESVRHQANPFGDGRSAERIVKIIEKKLAGKNSSAVNQETLPSVSESTSSTASGPTATAAAPRA
ncbi:UDP-N-acetylglucosamine 2-epimerase (non-hydrolyzing) [soil metagenome]